MPASYSNFRSFAKSSQVPRYCIYAQWMCWLPWVSLVDFSLGFLPFVCSWLSFSLFLDSGTVLGSTGQMFYKRSLCLNFTVSSQSDGGLYSWPPGHGINFYYDHCIMLKEHATHKTIAAWLTPNHSAKEVCVGVSIVWLLSISHFCIFKKEEFSTTPSTMEHLPKIWISFAEEICLFSPLFIWVYVLV